jgi:hypothetical protein
MTFQSHGKRMRLKNPPAKMNPVTPTRKFRFHFFHQTTSSISMIVQEMPSQFECMLLLSHGFTTGSMTTCLSRVTTNLILSPLFTGNQSGTIWAVRWICMLPLTLTVFSNRFKSVEAITVHSQVSMNFNPCKIVIVF